MRVICHECGGTGEIGTASDGRLISCETCGGHEDELGTGYLEARCMACPDKDAEITRLRAKLKQYEADAEWLRECDVYAALQEEIEKTDRQAEDYHGAIAWRDTEIARLRRALLAAPEPSYDIGRYIGASVGYRSWYQGQRQAALGEVE